MVRPVVMLPQKPYDNDGAVTICTLGEGVMDRTGVLYFVIKHVEHPMVSHRLSGEREDVWGTTWNWFKSLHMPEYELLMTTGIGVMV